MVKRRRRSRVRRMIEPVLDITGVSVSSSVIRESGATGSARYILDVVPTVQAARTLKKQARKIRRSRKRRKRKK